MQRVDLYSDPLTYDVGDGTGAGWPLGGPVSASLGGEAVISWRRLHDREGCEQDVAASRQSTEDLFERLREEDRERRRRKGRGKWTHRS
ncbi:MAG: hypothetical protein CL908_25270 [Deltaproteobacteria bacterium]|nr:hypothetical protein [Deltaproteobacteria bacterium]